MMLTMRMMMWKMRRMSRYQSPCLSQSPCQSPCQCPSQSPCQCPCRPVCCRQAPRSVRRRAGKRATRRAADLRVRPRTAAAGTDDTDAQNPVTEVMRSRERKGLMDGKDNEGMDRNNNHWEIPWSLFGLLRLSRQLLHSLPLSFARTHNFSFSTTRAIFATLTLPLSLSLSLFIYKRTHTCSKCTRVSSHCCAAVERLWCASIITLLPVPRSRPSAASVPLSAPSTGSR
jgi:hypothetical protein